MIETNRSHQLSLTFQFIEVSPRKILNTYSEVLFIETFNNKCELCPQYLIFKRYFCNNSYINRQVVFNHYIIVIMKYSVLLTNKCSSDSIFAKIKITDTFSGLKNPWTLNWIVTIVKSLLNLHTRIPRALCIPFH